MMAYMSVEDYQGILQGFLVGLVGAKRILEIGTFTGTSAIFFAHALKRNGVKGGADETGHKPIITLDISEEFAETSRQNFIEAGVEDYIEVLVGDANEIIKSLTDITFDIAFVDADKISYRNYYETIVNNDMLNKNGLFIFDNTAFPLDVPTDERLISTKTAIMLHEFNEYIRKDPRVEVVMLPLYTGITLVRLLH
ncbi:putative O-methyltransferase [Linderina pennispora]|uniref:Putative O-methyltransferase n=1 Tax=Linderina pennispora TaxID=61395 RepID=A0A1Y1WB31_9FUNG|nr:putative O-methyltransferase [Linderina pennispora]ORX70456.1 putative O-methyltransferase [Linderina pennispora]